MPAPPLSVLVLALASVMLGAAQVCLLALSGDRDGVLLAFAALVPLGFIATMATAGRAARREHHRLAQVAITDDLTGLGNARAFRQDIVVELARSRRSGRPLTLAMVDLNGLKATNDSLGHQAGDVRIRALGEALRDEARISDGIYRLGGDEFACLLADLPVGGGVHFAERVERRLEAGAGSAATFGLAEACDSSDPELLVRHADLALIEGKRTQRPTMVHAESLDARRMASRGEETSVGSVR